MSDENLIKEIDFYMDNPLFKVAETKIVNNVVEVECSLCVNDTISEFNGLSCCKIGKRPEIVWDENRDRAIFYCEKYKNYDQREI